MLEQKHLTLLHCFLKNNLREDIKILYSFCRYIDDLGDDSSIGKSNAIKKLNVIKNQLC